MALKVNYEVNAWSVGTTIGATTLAVITAWFLLQSDVRALQSKDSILETRISENRAEQARELQRIEAFLTKRIDLADQRAERDREAILTIQGDIRVVRQILEGMRAVPPPRP